MEDGKIKWKFGFARMGQVLRFNATPLIASSGKLGRPPVLCKWSRPFETVDTRFGQEPSTSPRPRNHIHSNIDHDHPTHGDDLNATGFIFKLCAIVCVNMFLSYPMSWSAPQPLVCSLWHTVNHQCCAAQSTTFS